MADIQSPGAPKDKSSQPILRLPSAFAVIHHPGHGRQAFFTTMSADTQAVLDRLDRATAELHSAAKAAIEIARAQAKESAARLGDDVEWVRMPGKGERCRITNFSRSKLNHLIDAGRVRKQRRAGGAFYSGADVRAILNSAE